MNKFNIKIIILVVLLLVLYVLSKNNFNGPRVEPSDKVLIPLSRMIAKQNKILNNFVESTPFVWKEKLMYFVSERAIDGKKGHKLAIYDFSTNRRISSFGEGLSLGSALVYNNTLYVFATKDWGKKGESVIFLIKSSDLKTFSDPVVIYRANPKQSVFNTSVTRNTDTGEFTMAMEVDEDGFVAFTIRLLKSDDLLSWKQVPNAIFGKDVYVACPAIRYINHEYYMWFLSEEYNDPNCKTCLTYVEKIAKSKDLVSWEISPYRFLVPGKDEGISTSDIDFAEYKNKVYIFYAAGDQATWSNMRYAIFNAPIDKMVDKFFEK
jgi:alpha-L-fucosidase